MPQRLAAHAIDSNRVSANAVAVVRGLRRAGFDAFLVGGCVRDLLLGATPKDFDVATAATPEQVREVFPRVRLVGRRFRIAHVRMKREVVEVSTFRRAVDHSADGSTGEAAANGRRRPLVSEHGMLLRDNAYGAIDEDAFRRDFTVNALYYDPDAGEVLDYCDGLADIEGRQLRTIGDPVRRFREDPVRILRAVRLAAKLDLALAPQTAAAIAPTRELLGAIPAARLFDEFIKMFLAGHGARTFEMLGRHGLPELLFPATRHRQSLARLALASTDQRIAEDKPVTPGFLLAAFLWGAYCARLPARPPGGNGGKPNGEEHDEAAAAALAAQRDTLAVPRRHSYFVRDVWRLQPLLENRRAEGVAAALGDRRFRAAYDFLMLRVAAAEVPEELGAWWTDAQAAPLEEVLDGLPQARPRRRPRRGRRRRPRAAAAPAGVVPAVAPGGG